MIQIRDDSRWNRRNRSENLPQISRRGWENIEEKVSRTFLSVRPLCFLALAQETTFFMSNQTFGTHSPFDASKILAKYLPISCLKRRRRWKKTKIRTALSSKCATFVPSHRVCSVTGLCEGRKWKTCRIQSPTERKKGKLEENLSISRSSSSPFNAIESKQIKLRRKKLKKPAPNESKKKSLAIAKQTIKRKWKRKHRSELELAAISFVRHRQSKTKSTLKLLFFRDARNRPLWAEYTRLDVGYMNG